MLEGRPTLKRELTVIILAREANGQGDINL